MKKALRLYCLPILILIGSCSQSVQLSYDFDHGSIGDFTKIKQGHFQGSTKHWLKRDSIGDQYYWFYFKADHVKDKEITFELGDLEGIYRGNPHIVYTDYTQPVYSYDQVNWGRIQDVSYDSALRKITFSHLFKSEPVWIAYAHPYSYQRMETFISSIEGRDFVSKEELAKTKEGRSIDLLTVTDPKIPDHDKRTVFIMAMQHAGEDAGTFYLEGMIYYLVSEKAEAVEARKRFVFKLIPMMNPDGVFNGVSRYNSEMEDLNNIWFSEDKMQPEVKGVQNWLEKWTAEGKQIDLFLDIHNHTQLYTYNVFLFKDNSMDILGIIMDKYWPTRIWHSEPRGSSHAYFLSKGIPSASVELTQSFSEKGDYLSISDYHSYGAGTVKGLLDYFSLDEDIKNTTESVDF